MRSHGRTWRAALSIALAATFCAGTVPYAARVRAAGTGLTVTLAPPSLVPSGTTTVVGLVTNSSGAPVAAPVTINAQGASIQGNNGHNPFSITLKPTSSTGSAGVTLNVSNGGYAPVTVPIRVGLPVVAEVSGRRKSLSVQAPGTQSYARAGLHQVLASGWSARTNASERGMLSFADSSLIVMNHNSTVSLENAHLIEVGGEVLMDVVPRGAGFQILTPTQLSLHSNGTLYSVRVAHGVTTVIDFSGIVIADDSHGNRAILHAGESLVQSVATKVLSPTTVISPTLPPWATGLQLPPPAGDTHVYLLQASSGLTPQSVLLSYSVETQQVLGQLTLNQQATDVAASPDGAAVYAATTGGVYRVSPDLTSQTLVGAAISATAVAVTPDGGTLLVGNSTKATLDLMDPATGSVRATIPLGAIPSAVTVDPTGKYAAVTGNDWVALVNVAASQLLMIRPVNAPPGRPCFDTDSQLVYVPLPDAGLLQMLSVAGLSWATSAISSAIGGTPSAVAPAPDGTVYVGLREGGVVDYNPISMTTTSVLATSPSVLAMVPSADGTLTASVSSSGFTIAGAVAPLNADLLHVDPLDHTAAYTPLSAPVIALTAYRPARSPDPFITPVPASLSVSSVPTVEAIPTSLPPPLIL